MDNSSIDLIGPVPVTTAQRLALFAFGYVGPEPEDADQARVLIMRLREEANRGR